MNIYGKKKTNIQILQGNGLLSMFPNGVPLFSSSLLILLLCDSVSVKE